MNDKWLLIKENIKLKQAVDNIKNEESLGLEMKREDSCI